LTAPRPYTICNEDDGFEDLQVGDEIDEDETIHYIYIYITDTRNDSPDLKIGYTKNIKQRISN
jgi:hypothetical protein